MRVRARSLVSSLARDSSPHPLVFLVTRALPSKNIPGDIRAIQQPRDK